VERLAPRFAQGDIIRVREVESSVWHLARCSKKILSWRLAQSRGCDRQQWRAGRDRENTPQAFFLIACLFIGEAGDLVIAQTGVIGAVWLTPQVHAVAVIAAALDA
jgi:hypothetical protein